MVSSSSLSIVSAGFSNECTLLAMLERLVCGAESKSLGGNLDEPKDQLLSTLNVDVVVSLVNGGVVCWELKDCRDAPNSYCDKAFWTCGSTPVSLGLGDDGQ